MPANILIFALGSSGDVHPMIALALSLRDRGHRVTFAVNPHFHPLCHRLNLTTLPIGDEQTYLDALESPDLWHPYKSLQYVLKELVVPTLPITFDQVAQMRPDLIIGTPLSLGARVAHDKLSIPYVTVNLAPTIFLSTELPPRLPGPIAHFPKWLLRGIFRLFDVLSDRVIGRPVNEFRRTHGLPPVRRILRDYWHSPQLPLCLFPDWLVAPDGRVPSDWPSNARLTGFVLYDESDVLPLPAELDSFLNAGPPPIVFTPGSGMTQGHDFFAQSLAAVKSLGARAIFLTRCTDQIPKGVPSPSPTNGTAINAPVVHFPFIPLSKLLPRCAAIVSHGGIGTIAQGLASGCPQLIMPMAHDQPDNAARVARLGAGLVLPRSRYTARRVTPLLGELLNNPAYKRNSVALSRRIDMGSARVAACLAIESLYATFLATTATATETAEFAVAPRARTR